MKKVYSKPEMQVIMFKRQTLLQVGSPNSGASPKTLRGGPGDGDEDYYEIG